MGSKGIVASSAAHRHPAAAGHRRHHPRLADAGARRRPHARGEGRAGTAADHGLPHLRAAGRGLPGLRPHHLDHVPGAGARHPETSSTISMPEWKTRYPGVEALNVAVMGCIVNGPGESKHADIGISLPGTGESPTAPGLHRRQEGHDAARPDHRRRLQDDGDRLHRAPLRPRRRRPHRGGVAEGESASIFCPSAGSGAEYRRRARLLPRLRRRRHFSQYPDDPHQETKSRRNSFPCALKPIPLPCDRTRSEAGRVPRRESKVKSA